MRSNIEWAPGGACSNKCQDCKLSQQCNPSLEKLLHCNPSLGKRPSEESTFLVPKVTKYLPRSCQNILKERELFTTTFFNNKGPLVLTWCRNTHFQIGTEWYNAKLANKYSTSSVDAIFGRNNFVKNSPLLSSVEHYKAKCKWFKKSNPLDLIENLAQIQCIFVQEK